jgi:hypothetical protein
MKKILLLTLSVMTSYISYSQDSTIYKSTMRSNKFIYDENSIKIYAGQELSISYKIEENNIKNLKLNSVEKSNILDLNDVSKAVLRVNSDSNLVIICKIVKEEDDSYMTFLIVNNPFGKSLKYKAKYFSRNLGEYKETDVLEIKPGISGIENWPFAIADFILYDLQLIE